jgi:amino acid transporter
MFFVALGTAVAVLVTGLFTSPPATPVDQEVYSLDLAKYGALYSAAVLWLLGVEVPFNMGAEFKDQRRAAGTMLLWGSLALLAAYLIGIAGVLWTTPLAEIDVTSGVAKGVGRMWPLGGVIVALAVCLAVSSQDIAYMNSYSRLLFISGIERRLPAVLGQVSSRSRVPVAALLVQAVGAIVVILIFSTQPSLAVAFNIYIGALVTVWCAALFYLYYGIVKARRVFAAQYAVSLETIWRIPGGIPGVWLVAIWGAVFNAIAIYYVFVNPMTTAIGPSAWRGWLAAIVGLVIAAGVGIFLVGEKSVSRINVEEELRKYEGAEPTSER